MTHKRPSDTKQTTVYIAHASEDKPLIRPVLDQLLSEKFVLWLDNPDKLGGAWYTQNYAQILRIEPGVSWLVSIQSAIEKADVVLAFWSKHSVQTGRDIFLFEVDRGRLLNKCIQIKVDDIPFEGIPSNFRIDQIFDLSSQVSDLSSSGAWRDIVMALRKSPESRKREDEDNSTSAHHHHQAQLVLIDASLDRHSSSYVQHGKRISRNPDQRTSRERD
jgi:hypothetical protein